MTKVFIAFVIGLITLSAQANQSECISFNRAVGMGKDSRKLKAFLDLQWKYQMRTYPEKATYVGHPGQNHRWTDRSIKAIQKRDMEARCQFEALQMIKRERLNPEEQLNYDLASHKLQMALDANKFGDDYLPVNHLEGLQINAINLIQAMPKNNVADYENILKRYEAFPTVIEQTTALMREGMKKKITPIKSFMGKVITQIDDLTPEDVTATPFFKFFADIGSSIPEKDKTRLQTEAKTILQSKIYPALKTFKTFVKDEYIPACRETLAWTSLPQGQDWYKFLVRYYTTTDLTPEQIHQVGIKEVERIGKKMAQIREQVKFKGDAKAFHNFLLKDKQFYFQNQEDLMDGYRSIAKKVDPELPRLFKNLPRLPYGVRAIPEHQAKSSPKAFYMRGSIEGGRAGFFAANAFDLSKTPKWDMETLTLHEAVPGHHLQIALAQELTNLPQFRRFGGFTAFTEGWALYAESLGEDIGLFKDPYSMYGHHSAEMMRAIRLVIDTGIHSKNWSKDQALKYFRENMPVSDQESEIEVDRYITWAGQALAYKVGEMKIQELRQQAKATLGKAFDLREFHDQVLRNGALPLNVLDKNVRAWMGNPKARPGVNRF